ncbi:UNVERIFIED_CONTAM: hypothetical protein FKN15_032081 [Acipenser sinensis]
MGDTKEAADVGDLNSSNSEGDTLLSNGTVACCSASLMHTVTPSFSEALFQNKGHHVRTLTPEEGAKLEKDSTFLSDFKQQKLENDAQKNWDLFYKRNSTNFFKDRHWTTREFEELRGCRQIEAQKLVLLEAGCGVGNCVFPLLEEDLNIFVYACDFSPRAVEYVKENPLYSAERCKTFQCDLTKDDLLQSIPPDSVDVATLIFVLSAIHPDKMHLAVENIYKVLKPGGCVLFRDYGLYDHAMLRFKSGNKLGDNFYVRQDGTRSFFFSEGPRQRDVSANQGFYEHPLQKPQMLGTSLISPRGAAFRVITLICVFGCWVLRPWDVRHRRPQSVTIFSIPFRLLGPLPLG